MGSGWPKGSAHYDGTAAKPILPGTHSDLAEPASDLAGPKGHSSVYSYIWLALSEVSARQLVLTAIRGQRPRNLLFVFAHATACSPSAGVSSIALIDGFAQLRRSSRRTVRPVRRA